MATLVSGLGLLVLLAAVVLPLPRVRQWLWAALARLAQTIVLAFLGACGTFFVKPEAAPQWLLDFADPVFEGTLGLPFDPTTGLPWLIAALVVVAASLPILMLLELGLNISAQTAQVHALRKEIRQAAAWVDGRLVALGFPGSTYPVLPNEGAAALEALRSTHHAHKDPLPTGPLVMDLLK